MLDPEGDDDGPIDDARQVVVEALPDYAALCHYSWISHLLGTQLFWGHRRETERERRQLWVVNGEEIEVVSARYYEIPMGRVTFSLHVAFDVRFTQAVASASWESLASVERRPASAVDLDGLVAFATVSPTSSRRRTR